LWGALSEMCLYAARRVPEISDNVVDVDRAMRWGFAWELGPFEIMDAIGLRAFAGQARKEGRTLPAVIEKVRAAGFFERAVQLDPNFALAWARLSRAHAAVYFVGTDTTAARRDAAKKALETAQKLQPNSPETQLALGYYQYYVPRDYGLAKSTFGLVGRMLPGSSEVSAALAFVARREGHWDERHCLLEEALALDPRNVEFLNQTAITYTMLSTIPDSTKAPRSSAGYRPQRAGCNGSKSQHSSGRG